MMRRARRHAFTLAEMMIGMVGSTIVVGALLLSSIELQKSLHASELYASNQADERRLLDCLSRDLRRSIGVATTTTVGGSGGAKLSGASAAVEGNLSLVLTLPGYYQSNTPGDTHYDQPLTIVAADNYVDYGTGNGHAPGVPVIFRKQYLETEGCTCFVRLEADSQTIVVRAADNMHLTVTMAADGRSATVEVTFLSPRAGSQTYVAMHDQILLRNIRLD
jgi:Tfp pilus assembly protein PilW